VSTAAWTCESKKHSECFRDSSATYYTPVVMPLSMKSVANLLRNGRLLSIDESGALGARNETVNSVREKLAERRSNFVRPFYTAMTVFQIM
jgi:hypothetical protein